MARTPQDAPPTRESDAAPAEDLSRDDDLLNSILVDQIAQSKGNKLGLHPQQVGFVGPVHKGEEVLDILQKYVIEHGNMPAAEEAFLRWGDIKAHLETKETNVQKGRFIKLLRRYLMIYGPNSRVEIYKTDRYRSVTLHFELGVYATRNLEEGTTLDELQGSVVKFPKSWEADLERGRLRDLNDDEEASGDEDASESEDEESKQRKSVPQRRSERTGRRDFSVLRSSLKNCLQLFLGPARFLNHDCQNNVELYRKDSYVTFKTVRPIAIGEELTTFYGSDYFGRGNRECMCLSCELAGTGYYKRHPTSRTEAEAVKRAARRAAEELSNSGPQGDSDDEETPASTPRKTRGTTTSVANSPAAMSSDESGDEQDPRQLPRELPKRAARNKSKKLDWSRRVVPTQRKLQRKFLESLSLTEDTESVSKEGDELHCVTCARPLEAYFWHHQQRFEFCERCVRHAMIFLMPWPAHRRADIRAYPPAHLVPRGYLPLKISNYVLPTYLPRPKLLVNRTDVAQQAANERAATLMQLNAVPDSREHRQARNRVDDAERTEYLFSQAAARAWAKEEEKRKQKQLQAEARERAKQQRAETKRRMNEGKEKGVGVWARYQVESQEEREARMSKKYQFVTGTRSGRKIREVSEDETEIDELARQLLLKERKAEQALTQKQREWREAHKAKRRGQNGQDDDGASEAPDETMPPTPGPSGQAQNVLAGKLLQAGGEEGEEDEDAENELLGAAAAGTALNPIDLVDDDDDIVPIGTSPKHSSRRVKQELRLSPMEPIVVGDSDDEEAVGKQLGATPNGSASSSKSAGSTSKPSSSMAKGSGSASKGAGPNSGAGHQPQPRFTMTGQHVINVEDDGNDAGRTRPRRGRPPGSGKHQKRRAMQEAKGGRHSLPSARPTSGPQQRRHSMLDSAAASQTAVNGRGATRDMSSPDEASPRDAPGGEDDHEAASAESVEGEIGLAARRPAKRREYAAQPEPVKKRKRYFFELQPGMNLPVNPILPMGPIDMRSSDSVR